MGTGTYLGSPMPPLPQADLGSWHWKHPQLPLRISKDSVLLLPSFDCRRVEVCHLSAAWETELPSGGSEDLRNYSSNSTVQLAENAGNRFASAMAVESYLLVCLGTCWGFLWDCWSLRVVQNYFTHEKSSILHSSQALFLVDVLVHHMGCTSHWYFDDFGRVANGNLSQEDKKKCFVHRDTTRNHRGGIPTSVQES